MAVKVADADGKINSWHQSAYDAARLAETRWISLRPNQSLGGYDIIARTANLSEPEWPDKTIEELVAIAFRHHFIHNPEHPVFKRLLGEL